MWSSIREANCTCCDGNEKTVTIQLKRTLFPLHLALSIFWYEYFTITFILFVVPFFSKAGTWECEECGNVQTVGLLDDVKRYPKSAVDYPHAKFPRAANQTGECV